MQTKDYFSTKFLYFLPISDIPGERKRKRKEAKEKYKRPETDYHHMVVVRSSVCAWGRARMWKMPQERLSVGQTGLIKGWESL
ncbi:MAG: hypothetical protein II901_01205 [Paludibacteraceae bacterium]|nr:hypothetical protein [Paludibacteraceae bacterium]